MRSTKLIIGVIFLLILIGCSNVKKDRNMSLSTAIEKGAMEDEDKREVNDAEIIYIEEEEDKEKDEENTFFIFGGKNKQEDKCSSTNQYQEEYKLDSVTELKKIKFSFGNLKIVGSGDNLNLIEGNRFALSTYSKGIKKEGLDFFISAGSYELEKNSNFNSKIEDLKFFNIGISGKGYFRDFDKYINPFFKIEFSRDFLFWNYKYELHDSTGSFRGDNLGVISVNPGFGMRLAMGNYFLEADGFFNFMFFDKLTSEGFTDNIFRFNMGPGYGLRYGVYFD